MAANKIISKIQEDASKEKETILAAAKEKAAAATNRTLAQAREQVDTINAQAQSEAEEIGRRQVLIAELESRKKTLASKRSVMEKVFAQVETNLLALPQAQWEKLITDIVLTGSVTGQEILHVPAADVDKYKNGFLAKLNAALTAQGKAGHLTLSEKPSKFKGGVELEGTTTDFDGSFEAILKDVRQKQERQVATLLFGTEVK